MHHDLSFPRALDAAYRLLTRRPHTRLEIARKLARRGYGAGVVDEVIGELLRKGYIDEDDTALRWAQALVRDKLWGPVRIAVYLAQKGIGRELVDRVQRQVWQEHEERAVAARAVAKRFPAGGPLSKKASFLRSRGFSADVIYAVLKDAPREDL